MMEAISLNKSSRKCSRGRCPDGTANPVDVYVGQRLTLRRKLLHISQESLARYMGITFQQIQKYEKGQNRISASRLYDFSQLLKVDMNYFFQDMPAKISDKSPMRLSPLALEKQEFSFQTPPELTSEAQELLMYYFKIKRPLVANALKKLLKALVSSSYSD